MSGPEARPGSSYLPALRFRCLTRFFDPILAFVLKEAALKGRLLDQARIEPGHRVLDLGCGTGTLLLQLKRRCPETQAVGLDADSEILRIASEKAAAEGLEVVLVEGSSTAPPLHPASFDRIVSSLFFHHLRRQDKLRTLGAARTLLKPGGEIHILDWGRPQSALMRAAFLGVQLLDGFTTTADNVAGRLPLLMERRASSGSPRPARKPRPWGRSPIIGAPTPHEAGDSPP